MRVKSHPARASTGCSASPCPCPSWISWPPIEGMSMLEAKKFTELETMVFTMNLIGVFSFRFSPIQFCDHCDWGVWLECFRFPKWLMCEGNSQVLGVLPLTKSVNWLRYISLTMTVYVVLVQHHLKARFLHVDSHISLVQQVSAVIRGGGGSYPLVNKHIAVENHYVHR